MPDKGSPQDTPAAMKPPARAEEHIQELPMQSPFISEPGGCSDDGHIIHLPSPIHTGAPATPQKKAQIWFAAACTRLAVCPPDCSTEVTALRIVGCPAVQTHTPTLHVESCSNLLPRHASVGRGPRACQAAFRTPSVHHRCPPYPISCRAPLSIRSKNAGMRPTRTSSGPSTLNRHLSTNGS